MILRLKGIISPRPVGVTIGESRLSFLMLSRGTALFCFIYLEILVSCTRKDSVAHFVVAKQLRGEGVASVISGMNSIQELCLNMIGLLEIRMKPSFLLVNVLHF